MSKFTKKYKIKDLPKYIHVSSSNNINLLQMEQQKESFKPNGFYYAKDIEWLKFMMESLGLTDVIKFTKNHVLTTDDIYLFSVNIPEKEKINISDKPESNKILIIDNVEDLDIFINRYYYKSYKSEKYSYHEFNKYINWRQVGKDYGGLEFNNYHKIRTLLKNKYDISSYISEYMIFDVFDVNGGVIWNVTNVQINKIMPK